MNIYIKPYIVENEKKRIFIVHGICEHSGRYKELAEAFNKEGFSVITYDLRGHGKSSGKPGYVKRFQDHIDDLSKVIRGNDNKAVKRYILGHSLGGLIGHIYMTTNKEKIDGFIASGAPTGYLKSVKPLTKIGYRWFGFLSVKNNFANGTLSRDTKVEEEYINDPLVLKKFKIRLAGEMFVRGVKYLRENVINNIRPILLLHGKNDKIVPKEQSEDIYKKISHKDKKLKIYNNMYHEIFNEIGKEKVINDVVNWLNEQ